MGTSYKLIKIQPAVTAADNDDNDVIFDWTEIPNFSSGRGMAALLESVALMDRNDTGHGLAPSFDLYFCRGSYVNNTASAPTSAQRLGAADAVVDITGAEAKRAPPAPGALYSKVNDVLATSQYPLPPSNSSNDPENIPPETAAIEP